MTLKKTLLLAIVLAGLALFVFRYEIPREKSEKEREFLLAEIQRDGLDRIKIQRKSETIELKNLEPGKPIESVKPHDHGDDITADEIMKNSIPAKVKWEFADIEGAAADSVKITTLMNALTSLKGDAKLDSKDLEEDLSVYGLKEPEATLTLTSKGKEVVLDIGKKNEYLGKNYVKFRNSPDIYLVGTALFEAASQSKKDFRDKALIQFTDSDIQSVEVAAGKEKMKFERDSAKWRISSPISATASAARVSELLMNLRNIRVEEFKDSEPFNSKSLGLASPAAKVSLSFKDAAKSPINLSFGRVGDFVWFSFPEKTGAYRTNLEVISKIQKPLEEYREKNLFRFDTSDAVAVVSEGELGQAIRLEKSGDDWKVNGKNGDEAFISQYLRDLADVEARSFPNSNEKLGFDKPRHKVVVALMENGVKSERTLLIGNPTKEGAFAAVGGLSEPFVIESKTVKAITQREEVLVKVDPTPTPSPASK